MIDVSECRFRLKPVTIDIADVADFQSVTLLVARIVNTRY